MRVCSAGESLSLVARVGWLPSFRTISSVKPFGAHMYTYHTLYHPKHAHTCTLPTNPLQLETVKNVGCFGALCTVHQFTFFHSVVSIV